MLFWIFGNLDILIFGKAGKSGRENGEYLEGEAKSWSVLESVGRLAAEEGF